MEAIAGVDADCCIYHSGCLIPFQYVNLREGEVGGREGEKYGVPRRASQLFYSRSNHSPLQLISHIQPPSRVVAHQRGHWDAVVCHGKSRRRLGRSG